MSINNSLHKSFQAAPSLVPLLSLARATLLLTPPGTIRLKTLQERAIFLFRHFRLSFNRRQRKAKNDNIFSKICVAFLKHHPGRHLSPTLMTLAGIAMSLATSTRIEELTSSSEEQSEASAPERKPWEKVRRYLLQRKPIKSWCPWPLQSGKASELKIVFWNCNGHHTKEYKRTLLEETAQETKASIISLVETKTRNPKPPTRRFICCGHTSALSRGPRSQNLAGGICIGKTPSVATTVRTQHIFTGFIEAIASKVKHNNSRLDFTMITAYIPPFSVCPLRGAFEDKNFLDQLRLLYGRPLLLVADANCDIATWTGRGTKTIRTLLKDGWQLKSSPHEPTSLHTQQGKCIDIVLTRDFPSPCTCEVLPLSTTDHQGLLIKIYDVPSSALRPSTCHRQAAIVLARALEERDEEHPHYKLVQELLDAHPRSAASTSQDAPLFSDIIGMVNKFEAATASKPSPSEDKLYGRLKALLSKHYSLIYSIRNHGTKTRSHRHLSNLLSSILKLKGQTTRVVNSIRSRASTQDAVDAISTATQDLTSNAIIRRIERACNPRNPLIDFSSLDRSLLDNHRHFWEQRWSTPYLLPQERQDLLKAFLESDSPSTTLNTRSRSFSITHKDGAPWLVDDMELIQAIGTLCNGRAPGPSGLPVDFFKITTTFHQELCDLFNSIITHEATPHQFSPCRLILLHKAGLVTEPKNYRPINLTETGFRIFEAVIRLRLASWTDNILHQNQYGFRRAQSTMSALLSVVTEIHSAISQLKPLYACFLDAVKAFDRVPHQAILEACMQYGLSSSSCRLLSAMISKHTSTVFDPSSQEVIFDIPVNCGVLQGGINSPPLFTLFANTLFDDLHPQDPSDTRLYADDRTVLTDLLVALQDSFNQLETWAATRNLIHDGNELLVFNAPDPPALHIHGKPIIIASSTVCLGMTISKDGTVARANVVSKANHTVIKLSSLWSRARSRIPFSMLKTLIARYFIPTTTYGSALSTMDAGISLDKSVYKIIRNAISCHPSTNTTLLLEFTGIIRPSIRIQQELISVLCRSLINSSSIVQDAIRTQFRLKLPFATKISKLLLTLKVFPLFGPSLSKQLQDILAMPPAMDSNQPRLAFTPDPYTPPAPSKTHLLAFTDGSKTEDGLCGCATILLIGVPGEGHIISSSFYLPQVKDNNVAELQAIVNVIDQAIIMKTSTFPDLDSVTIVSDSLNCVKSAQGTFLITDSSFLTLFHQLARTLSSTKIKLFLKWVKAHDSGTSPFNERADSWADRSITEKQPLTETSSLTQEDVMTATMPIAWGDSEAFPQDNADIIRSFRLIAKNAILLQEDARYRQQLTRYIDPSSINFPGTGSQLLNSSTQPRGHFLLNLRRDPEDHLNDYLKLQKFSETCPWCRSGTPNNTHLFLECSLSKISRTDRRAIQKSRLQVLGHDPPTDSQALKRFFVTMTSQSYVMPADADNIIKAQARMRRLYQKYNSRSYVDDSDSSQESQDSQDPQDDSGLDAEASEQPAIAPRQLHHGAAARLIILDRIEACRTVEELDNVFAHYGNVTSVYDDWARRHSRMFFRPSTYRNWLHRIEDYLTILNCPTWELRYHAYCKYETSDRACSKLSTRPVTSQSTGLPPRYAGRFSTNMTGFRDQFQALRKFIATKLLRHDANAPVLPSRPSRHLSKPYKPPLYRRIASPPWAFELDWSLQLSTPFVEAWFAAPTNDAQRRLVRSVWPEEWPKNSVIQTHMKIDPALYTRQTLVNSRKGKGLLQLFDLIRDAFASKELTSTPAFPELTELAIAKQSTAKTHQAAYQSAALICIFTPIEILRRQVSFHINPLNISQQAKVNFPNLQPFLPRIDTYQCVSDLLSMDADTCVANARAWAKLQMNRGRHFTPSFFPELPQQLEGSETTWSQSGSTFDDDFSSLSDDSSGSDNV
jgi:ribonuclease HI